MAQLNGAVLLAHGPLRVGLKGIAPIEVGAHARDHSHVPLLCGSHTLAEEIATIQEFSMAVKLYL